MTSVANLSVQELRSRFKKIAAATTELTPRIFNENMTITQYIDAMYKIYNEHHPDFQYRKEIHKKALELHMLSNVKDFVCDIAIEMLITFYKQNKGIYDQLEFYKKSKETQFINEYKLFSIRTTLENKSHKIYMILFDLKNRDIAKKNQIIVPWNEGLIRSDNILLKDVLFHLRDVILPQKIYELHKDMNEAASECNELKPSYIDAILPYKQLALKVCQFADRTIHTTIYDD